MTSPSEPLKVCPEPLTEDDFDALLADEIEGAAIGVRECPEVSP